MLKSLMHKITSMYKYNISPCLCLYIINHSEILLWNHTFSFLIFIHAKNKSVLLLGVQAKYAHFLYRWNYLKRHEWSVNKEKLFIFIRECTLKNKYKLCKQIFKKFSFQNDFNCVRKNNFNDLICNVSSPIINCKHIEYNKYENI